MSQNDVDLVALLKACAKQKNLYKGIQIHDDILKKGLLHTNVFIGNSLINLYAKCGELASAKKVFDDLPNRDLISWNALVTGYAQHGHGEKALSCFEGMQCEGLSPDGVTLASILKACGSLGALEKGKDVHIEIAAKGLLQKDVVLGNALVDMYAKCGALAKAQEVFDELPNRNVISWNALIGGYRQHGHGEEALKCFEKMKHGGYSPDAVTFTCVLNACGSAGAAEKGEEVYAEIVQTKLLETNIVLGSALVDMYAKIGELAKAQLVFDKLPVRSVVSWTALILGYCEHDHGEKALSCFEWMKHEGLFPDAITYSCILKACGTTKAVDKGKELHAETARKGLAKDLVVGNALVDMYAKCGALAHSREVFDDLEIQDVVSWNALVSGYCQYEHGKEALGCYERMTCEGLSPDAVTFSCILKACGIIGGLDKGVEVHAKIVTQGLLMNGVVLGNALIDMYAKCGQILKAWEVFESLSVHDVVSWNALLTGFCENELSEEALQCFRRMKSEGISPDDVTFSCTLKICGSIGATENGREVHAMIVKLGWLSGESCVLGNVLVDMYAKCGVLGKAQQVFEELRIRDTISWNTLIAGFCQHGHGEEARLCYEQMKHEDVSPDAATFACILKSCSSLGAAEKGEMYFESMSLRYGMILNLEHYTCMVDLFARAGHFDKAMTMIKKMPSFDYLPAWSALLTACQKWANVKLGRLAFENVVRLDEKAAAAYVSISGIFAAACLQEDEGNIKAHWKKQHQGTRTCLMD